MKKRFALTLLSALTVLFSGCGDDSSNKSKSDADKVTDEVCNKNLAEYCDGETAIFCGDDNKLVRRDCTRLNSSSNPVTCHVSQNGVADCVLPCDANNFKEYGTCSGKIPEHHTCERTKDNNTYEFVYTDDEACPNACSDGFCVDGSAPVEGGSCNPDDSVCFGNAAYACVKGKFVKTTCLGDSVCATQYGSKEPQCVTSCRATDGSGDDYSCIEEDGKPTTNNRVCRVDSDGRYFWFTEKKTCSTSCSDGICDITIPQEGSTCDENTASLCVGNTLYKCDDGEMVKLQCGTDADVKGQPFCRQRDANFAGCGAPCSEGSESMLSCTGKVENGNASTENRVCSKALDGSFYYFLIRESCPNGCSKGVCL